MTGLIRLVLMLTAIMALGACQSRRGNDPIISAVALNDTAKVTAYLAEGGNPQAKSKEGDPLLYIASGPRGGVAVARLLIEAGSNIEGQSADGRKILQNAASWCDIEMVALLVEAGANVNAAGADGTRPLDAVCKSPQDRREKVIEMLLAAGGLRG